MTIKEKLKEILINNHFDVNGNAFTKHGDRRELTITLYDNEVEVYYREYPAKEGWYINKYPYNKKLLKQISNTISWI